MRHILQRKTTVKGLLLVIGYTSLWLSFAQAQALPVIVFTDQEHPIDLSTKTEVSVTYYRIDTLKELLNEINTRLKNSTKYQASHEAKFFLANHQVDFVAATRGLVKLQKLKLTQYPAIVLGTEKAVIYGQSNLNNAIEEYEQWKAKKESTY